MYEEQICQNASLNVITILDTCLWLRTMETEEEEGLTGDMAVARRRAQSELTKAPNLDSDSTRALADGAVDIRDSESAVGSGRSTPA